MLLCRGRYLLSLVTLSCAAYSSQRGNRGEVFLTFELNFLPLFVQFVVLILMEFYNMPGNILHILVFCMNFFLG